MVRLVQPLRCAEPIPFLGVRGAAGIGERQDLLETRMTTAVQDFKVADIGLADFGRREIVLAEHGPRRAMQDRAG